ncbi:putative glycosyl hydrolase [Desulfosporosinus orientis DSM 765]|uniref:Putative glycosyl hydrolase n=1 Tax=Desulfosporosinus orientis (strain ATCC 19365 / DSM 765 / NCIMB 8382 / VKM B-1628 / Singapore I) TaxID=768706 RepID=G7WH72_DESOD|nr:glycosyl hydrolase family 18 protein [Desulfosporosinus orientis]AET69580.1 putative glycosyl hydrolase [Desulfosporosinus orientis DSM 765]
MKRYLTLIIAFIIILMLELSGCSGVNSPQLSSPQHADEKGQLPEAEASRDDVLGSGKRVVLGFYTDFGKASKDSLTKNIKALDEVAFFWYSFDGTGNPKPVGNVDLSLKDAAQKGGAKAYALVHNLGAKGFDSQLAHQVLANKNVRADFIKNLVTLTITEHWDGIAIDIEKIPADDRNDYSAFLAELNSALKAKNKILNVSIAAKYQDDPKDLWSGAFDYAAIGKAADQVVLMTYEEHGVDTTQGPIASYGWVNRVINFAKGKIPEEKIVMGLAVYASNWASNKPTMPTYLTYAKAVELAKKNNVSILYDETQQVPHFTFTTAGIRHEIYLENTRSLAAKLTIAKKNQLHGVAIWKLGIEDPSLWSDVLKDYPSAHK